MKAVAAEVFLNKIKMKADLKIVFLLVFVKICKCGEILRGKSVSLG